MPNCFTIRSNLSTNDTTQHTMANQPEKEKEKARESCSVAYSTNQQTREIMSTTTGWLLEYVLEQVNDARRRDDQNHNNDNKKGVVDPHYFSSDPRTLQIRSREGNFFNGDNNNSNSNGINNNNKRGSFITTDGKHTIKVILTKNCLNDINNHVMTRHTPSQQSKFWEYSRDKCGVIRKYKLIIDDSDNEPQLLVDKWEPQTSCTIESLLFGNNNGMIHPIRDDVHFRHALQQQQQQQVEQVGDVQEALKDEVLRQQILNQAEQEDDDSSSEDDDEEGGDQENNNHYSNNNQNNNNRDAASSVHDNAPNIDQMLISPLSTQKGNNDNDDDDKEEEDDDDGHGLYTQPMSSPTVPSPPSRKYRPRRLQEEEQQQEGHSSEPSTNRPHRPHHPEIHNKKKKRPASSSSGFDDTHHVQEKEQQQLPTSATTTPKKRKFNWRDLVQDTTDDSVLEDARNPLHVKNWQGLSKWLPKLILGYKED